MEVIYSYIFWRCWLEVPGKSTEKTHILDSNFLIRVLKYTIFET